MILTSGNNRPASKRRTLKLVLAGTIALTAAAIGIMCLQKGSSSEEIRFYGDSQHSEKQAAFMQFLAKYGKTYATKSDLSSRFQIFSENFDRVKEHNNQAEKFTMGINRFSDMSIEEFSSLYGTQGLTVKEAQP